MCMYEKDLDKDLCKMKKRRGVYVKTKEKMLMKKLSLIPKTHNSVISFQPIKPKNSAKLLSFNPESRFKKSIGVCIY